MYVNVVEVVTLICRASLVFSSARLVFLPVKFFSPNIQTPGRIARGLCGVAALVGAWFCREQTVGCATLALSGVVMIFEAFRGWCLARACGLKTPM